jgi:alpha-tubulin suppressor-like RCC1 family protein
MNKSSHVLTRKSLPVGAGLCTVAAAVALASGCSSSQRSATVTVKRSVTATVKHWGSFFGGPKGNFDTTTAPAAVTLPGIVAKIGTSNSTEYALLTNGRLYAWGLGTQGELGDGGRQNSFVKPVRVRFPAGVKIASIPTDVMPYDSGLAVDTHGNAWGWGRNAGGELCLGNKRIYRTPVKLPLSHVTTLAGASGHALYDAGGALYACGQNSKGDLGDGSTRSSTRPVRIARLKGSSVTELVASFSNSGALLSDGEYFDWGYDGAGQLGQGRIHRSSDIPVKVDLPRPVAQVAQGGSIWNNGQTLVLLSDGSLWSWGNNRAYQLGNGTTRTRSLPRRFSAPAGVTYQSLATGSATGYALSTSGDVYAWGVSHVGQVGDGDTGTSIAPVLVASGATLISATANNVVINVPRRT